MSKNTQQEMEERYINSSNNRRCDKLRDVCGVREEGYPNGTYQYLKCNVCGRKWHHREMAPFCGSPRTETEEEFNISFIQQELTRQKEELRWRVEGLKEQFIKVRHVSEQGRMYERAYKSALNDILTLLK